MHWVKNPVDSSNSFVEGRLNQYCIVWIFLQVAAAVPLSLRPIISGCSVRIRLVGQFIAVSVAWHFHKFSTILKGTKAHKTGKSNTGTKRSWFWFKFCTCAQVQERLLKMGRQRNRCDLFWFTFRRFLLEVANSSCWPNGLLERNYYYSGWRPGVIKWARFLCRHKSAFLRNLVT